MKYIFYKKSNVKEKVNFNSLHPLVELTSAAIPKYVHKTLVFDLSVD